MLHIRKRVVHLSNQNISDMATTLQVSEIAKAWRSLDSEEKLELIQEAIEDCNTNDGFLMLQYWRAQDCLGAYIRQSLVNHLCVEAVSQDTLVSLFGENHDFTPEDAAVILEWMNAQQ